MTSHEGQQVPNAKRLITADRAARILTVSRASVYRRVDAGTLVGVKLHSRRRCSDSCRCPVRITLASVRMYLKAIGAAAED